MVILAGQDRAVAQFRQALNAHALHHAWLLAGPPGVGKASFATLAATRLLAQAAGPPVDLPGLETPADHPIARYVAARSHPDFRWLAREINPKTDTLRRNITVDQVRALGGLLANTTSLSPWRAVVIDSVDELERESANALLKMLEEPPENTLFLLVAHNPGRLLPTIRSRCRRLDFQRLDDNEMTSVLGRSFPELTDQEAGRLITIAGGSPGRAIAFAGLGLGPIEAAALAILREGDPTNARRSKLGSGLTGKAGAERYAAFLQLIPTLIAGEARLLSGPQQTRALDAYASAREIAATAQRMSLDPATTAFQMGTILASVA